MDVKSFAITCIKVAPWAVLAAVCAKACWDIGSKPSNRDEKPVEPFKDIPNHKFKDYLPK